MGSLFKYEPEAPGEEFLEKYVYDTKNDDDYFDIKDIFPYNF